MAELSDLGDSARYAPDDRRDRGKRAVLEWKRVPIPGRQAVHIPLGEQWTYTFCISTPFILGLDEVNPHICAEGNKPCGDRVSE